MTMAKFSNIVILLCAVVCLSAVALRAEDEVFGKVREVSPDGQYAFTLTDGLEKSEDRNLVIWCGNKALGSYSYPSYLQNFYWSPKSKYLAINNHFGHRCWSVWVLRLSDGAVLRAAGPEHSPKYSRELDYTYFPDILAQAQPMLEKLYPGYSSDEDHRGGGHITVTYGWKDADTLLIYDEVVLDNLFEKEKRRLSIYSLLHILKTGFRAELVSVEKTDYEGKKDRRPEAVRSVLGY